jgi:HAD superfamily hydrolase (TIGR01549 family)
MNIFFDIDDTLVDSESAHRAALKIFCEGYPIFAGETPDSLLPEWFTINDKFLTLYFDKKISLEQQRISRIRSLWGNRGLSVKDDLAQKIFSRYYHCFLHSCSSFPDIDPCLQKLKGYKLGMISNGITDDQIFKLKNNHLFHFFNTVIISEKMGVVKPGREIFQMAALNSGTEVSDCIFIGNSYETDYLGSLQAGMKAIWLDRKNSNEHPGSEKIVTLNELINHPFLSEKN